MSRVLRFAWVLLLTLALPLQGLAAATMAACGPVHGDAGGHAAHAQEASTQAFDHEASGHEAHGHGSRAHAAHGAHATHLDTATTDNPPAGDTSATPPNQKCSVCASCCTASAGLPSQSLIAVPAATAESSSASHRAARLSS